MSKKNGKNKAEDAIGIELPIRHIFPADHSAKASNHMMVQHTPREVHLLFFQIRPPIVIENSPDKVREEYRKLDHVDSNCVAEIMLSPERFLEFAALVETQKAKLLKKIGKTEAKLEKGE